MHRMRRIGGAGKKGVKKFLVVQVALSWTLCDSDMCGGPSCHLECTSRGCPFPSPPTGRACLPHLGIIDTGQRALQFPFSVAGYPFLAARCSPNGRVRRLTDQR